ncbi:hypothetical protein FRC01_002031 [Tulasnella sp. 417]|nr:hypothetical protein FRC01_002031 [Tulasnella sp. 417]
MPPYSKTIPSTAVTKDHGSMAIHQGLIRKSASASLRRKRLDLKDRSRRHGSLPISLSRRDGLQKDPPIFIIDDDIFVIIASLLGVRGILALRRTPVKQVKASYALPLCEVPSTTLEELCLRATRMVDQWDERSTGNGLQFSRCLQRPWNSVTWMELLRSRWLLLQLDGVRLELWDLCHPFNGTPADCFNKMEGAIDGFKALFKGDNHHTLLLSTRSYKTFDINTFLPHMRELQETGPYFGEGHCVQGCSGLLDVTEQVAAYSRCYDEQGAIIQDRRSGKMAILQSSWGDPKLSHAAAIQIRPNVIVVARIQGIDIYSMVAVKEHLGSEQASQGKVFITPIQSIPYMGGYSALHAYFLDSSCAGWVKFPYEGPGGIYLGVDTNIGTRTIQVISPQCCDDGELKFQLSSPLRLLVAYTDSPEYPTVLFSWGASARRMVYLNETTSGLYLFGLSIPLGFRAETGYPSAHKRCKAWWRLPNAMQDLARFTAFDESTGISIVAMASGCIWIADPSAISDLAALDEPPQELNFDQPPHPDPAWPRTHPLPWPRNPGTVNPTPIDWDTLPQISTAVEQYFPSKNDPACFGGATWFASEALHIPGPARAVLFGAPDRINLMGLSFEVFDVVGRFLVIKRDDHQEFYGARLLSQSATMETITTYLREGRDFQELPGCEVPVDGSARNRYAAWRRRLDKPGPLCMW